MNVIAKIKETLLEHVVLTVLGVIGLLLLIIWQAINPEIWTKISEATPKRILWACLGLLGIIAILECVYIYYLYRRLHPNLTFRFGVLWDKKLNPYCPKDNIALYQWGRTNGMARGPENFVCSKCDRNFELRDDSRKIMKLKDAQARIRSDQGAI